MNVLIVPDKFKGTLTAREAGEAIAQGWRAVRPLDHVEILPMSDGGDGFGEVIGGMMGAREIKVATVDSAHRPREASLWFDDSSGTAIIEAAQVNGLALLPPGMFHPIELDTFGLGKVYQAAAELGAKKILVGIGGSSTNDGGFGLAKALGWTFLDAEGARIEKWTDLDRLEQIKRPSAGIFIETIVAVDVQNPLLGPAGASRIYGPQKGLREADMPKAEACLGRLALVVNAHFKRDFATEPGTGAAGGLGFGLKAFCNAAFLPGSEVFAKAARLDERLKSANIVISGEGAIDAQSLMGKGVGELFQRCKKAGLKRIGLAGSVSLDAQMFAADPGLTLMGIVPALATLEQAKTEPFKWLALLASEAAKKFDGERKSA